MRDSCSSLTHSAVTPKVFNVKSGSFVANSKISTWLGGSDMTKRQLRLTKHPKHQMSMLASHLSPRINSGARSALGVMGCSWTRISCDVAVSMFSYDDLQYKGFEIDLPPPRSPILTTREEISTLSNAPRNLCEGSKYFGADSSTTIPSSHFTGQNSGRWSGMSRSDEAAKENKIFAGGRSDKSQTASFCVAVARRTGCEAYHSGILTIG